MRIERICPNEAEALYHCMKQIDKESQFMLYLPDERNFNHQQLSEELKFNFYIGVKTDEGEIVGYLMVHISTISKIKHIGYINTGMINAYRKQGYATQMFEETLKWAERKGLRRLELTVITTNTPAVNFYEKLGFKIEGIKRQSIFMDDHYFDELYMAKLLNEGLNEENNIIW
ncbi:GNAT family N-acetyltransferase [Staphylococcus sp. ACRSN]|uniref:GNAT family N-acetyltransferase n=1 Tax=Staphylococcus sp. ACRSN TaxID=2918214 RepID=UPI001EF3637A|nr:GNAT family N-acetyltransferase [Staphylococcus sp. ACRSN]MCG7338008.1 GNAT family N-acetyltransferase [Staphylococcus sp. ACRSN]